MNALCLCWAGEVLTAPACCGACAHLFVQNICCTFHWVFCLFGRVLTPFCWLSLALVNFELSTDDMTHCARKNQQAPANAGSTECYTVLLSFDPSEVFLAL